MRRDRLTFAMIVGIPILQLVLFGYAINTDPKALPTAIVDHDRSEFSRSLGAAISNTGYFAVVAAPASDEAADRLLARGEIQFAVIDPAGLLSSPAARRAAATVGGRRCDRPCGYGQRAERVERARVVGAASRPEGSAGLARDAHGAVRRDGAAPLQRRGRHAIQHRAGAARRDPADDDGHDDRVRRDARARARNVREPARDAGDAARGDDRQDRPVHRRRLRAGGESS